MTTTPLPPRRVPADAVTRAMRRQLVHEARHDLAAALPAAVAFVRAHPAQADVLSELGVIAAASAVAVVAFRAAVRELLADAVRGEAA